jgi:hypothetical protein
MPNVCIRFHANISSETVRTHSIASLRANDQRASRGCRRRLLDLRRERGTQRRSVCRGDEFHEGEPIDSCGEIDLTVPAGSMDSLSVI